MKALMTQCWPSRTNKSASFFLVFQGLPQFRTFLIKWKIKAFLLRRQWLSTLKKFINWLSFVSTLWTNWFKTWWKLTRLPKISMFCWVKSFFSFIKKGSRLWFNLKKRKFLLPDFQDALLSFQKRCRNWKLRLNWSQK